MKYKLHLLPTNIQRESSITDGGIQTRKSNINKSKITTDLLPREIKNNIKLVPLSEKNTSSIDGDYICEGRSISDIFNE